MAKITLTDVANITGSETSAIAAINDNNSALETAIENTLSRDGTSPNAMNFDFDMNGYDILNAGLINGVDVTDLTGDTGPQGPQGDPGTNGTGVVWKGAYSGATAYILNDAVSDQSSSWISLGSHTGSAPPTLPTTSNASWQLMAQKGTDGAGSGDMLKATYDAANISQQVVGTTASQSITNKKLGSLTTNGFVKTSSGDGTLSVDTTSYQTLDSDLTTIAGLTATTDNFMQSKSSAWASRTPTQVTADLIAMVGDSGSGGTKGLVPAPSSGDNAAGKFLKANGTWAVPSGGGGTSVNTYLEWIYQSKLFVGYRRGIELFADGYKASDGVNSGSSSNYTVDTSGGKVGPTSSSPTNQIITHASSSYTSASGTISASTEGAPAWQAVDGVTTGSAYWSTSGAQSGTLQYQFGSAKTIASYKITANITSFNRQPTAWTFEGSNNGSSWTTLDTQTGQSFAVQGENTYTVASPASFTYYRLNITACNSGANLTILEWKLYDAGSPNNMTLVTTSQTADATVSNGRVLMEIDPISSITLNTDLTAEVSCNGGTNYTTCTLVSSGKGQAGRTVLDTGVQVIANSGTSFIARIKTLNNKSINVYGLTLEVS